MAGNQMKIFRYFDWGTILVFGIAGPPVCDLGFLFWQVLKDPDELSHLADIANIGRAFFNFAYILPIFYSLAFVPALWAGLLFGIVWKMWPERIVRNLLTCAIAGGGIGVLAVLSWAVVLGFPDYTTASLSYGLGTYSGAVCALLVLYCKGLAQKPPETAA